MDFGPHCRPLPLAPLLLLVDLVVILVARGRRRDVVVGVFSVRAAGVAAGAVAWSIVGSRLRAARIVSTSQRRSHRGRRAFVRSRRDCCRCDGFSFGGTRGGMGGVLLPQRIRLVGLERGPRRGILPDLRQSSPLIVAEPVATAVTWLGCSARIHLSRAARPTHRARHECRACIVGTSPDFAKCRSHNAVLTWVCEERFLRSPPHPQSDTIGRTAGARAHVFIFIVDRPRTHVIIVDRFTRAFYGTVRYGTVRTVRCGTIRKNKKN